MRKREYRFEVRFTENEYRDFCDKVTKSGLNGQEFIRSLVKGSVVKEAPPADLPYFIRELRRVGSNINQILKIANSLHLLDVPKVREALEDTRKLEKLIVRTYAKEDS